MPGGGINLNVYSCSKNQFCQSIPPQIRKNMCNIAQINHYKSKQTVTIDIGTGGKLILITKGMLIPIKQQTDGKQVGVECLGTGSIIGITKLFCNTPDTTIFYTKTDVEVCLLPCDDFEDLCLSYPELVRLVVRNLSQRFGLAIATLEHLALDNSTDKILYLIKKLSYGRSSSPNHLSSFTHEELALLAGINRVTASRAIKKLKVSGIIIDLGKGKFKMNVENITDKAPQ